MKKLALIVICWVTLAYGPFLYAASATEIDIKVDAAVERFKSEVQGGAAFLKKASGLLVFPEVMKAGFGIGGEYGEGALRVNGKTVDYLQYRRRFNRFSTGRAVENGGAGISEPGGT